MRANNVLFICLSIFLPFSAFASDTYSCTPFVGIEFSNMLKGSHPVGDLGKRLQNIEDESGNSHSESILLDIGDEPSLWISKSIPLKQVGETSKLLTPLKFFKTQSPVTKKDFGGMANNVLADVYTLDNSPITNVLAVAAEKYAVLLPETGSAISVCKKHRLEYSESGARAALDRLQQAMISSGLLREVLSEQFDAQSKQLFPNLRELLETTGLYGSDGSFISGVDVGTVGTTLVAATIAIQTLRMLTATLTRNPALAAIVFPTPDAQVISIDANKLGLTSAQVKHFLNQSADIQRERCQKDFSVKQLCTVLGELNFKIAYVQGNAT